MDKEYERKNSHSIRLFGRAIVIKYINSTHKIHTQTSACISIAPAVRTSILKNDLLFMNGENDGGKTIPIHCFAENESSQVLQISIENI